MNDPKPKYVVYHDARAGVYLIEKGVGLSYTISAYKAQQAAWELEKKTGQRIGGVRGNEEWLFKLAQKESEYIEFEQL